MLIWRKNLLQFQKYRIFPRRLLFLVRPVQLATLQNSPNQMSNETIPKTNTGKDGGKK